MMCIELHLGSCHPLLLRVGTILQHLYLYIVQFQSSLPFWWYLLVASPSLRIGSGLHYWQSRSLFTKIYSYGQDIGNY
jgi:hypothetical protein